MPNIYELISLLYCSTGFKDSDQFGCRNGSIIPTIENTHFPNTVIWYWTSTSFPTDTSFARIINFDEADVYKDNKSSGANGIRLVRDGQSFDPSISTPSNPTTSANSNCTTVDL